MVMGGPVEEADGLEGHMSENSGRHLAVDGRVHSRKEAGPSQSMVLQACLASKRDNLSFR
jgi:hypothetical protein